MSATIDALVIEANSARSNLARAVADLPLWHARDDAPMSRGYVGELVPASALRDSPAPKVALALMAYVLAVGRLQLAVQLDLARRNARRADG